jgi:hypothetical protein
MTRLPMTKIRAHIRVAPDGTISGRVPGLPAGDHDAEIALIDAPAHLAEHDVEEVLKRIRRIQEEIARLPILDDRSPDEIVGYNKNGHFD